MDQAILVALVMLVCVLTMLVLGIPISISIGLASTIAMLCALAYVVMAVGRVPVVLFLKYDPKDVVITLGGLIWGPMTACLVSVLVSVLEMFTVSDTGILGCIMNILSTCAFACTASAIYRKQRTLAGAVPGLAAG